MMMIRIIMISTMTMIMIVKDDYARDKNVAIMLMDNFPHDLAASKAYKLRPRVM